MRIKIEKGRKKKDKEKKRRMKTRAAEVSPTQIFALP